MSGTFNCPTCGAPLGYSGTGETMRCPYCNNSVIVPEDLHPHDSIGGFFQTGGGLDLNRTLQQAKLLKEVADLARNDKEIEAIKLFRQVTGCGLVEAKTAVDSIRSGNPVQLNQIDNHSQSQVLGNTSIPPEKMAEIKQFLQSNQKIEAIKVFRQVTHSGLKEAKDEVESMERTWKNSGDWVQLTGSKEKQPENLGAKIRGKLLGLLGGLFFLGLASIFPIVFIPMGIEAIVMNEWGGAIGAFIGAGVWALAWGGIGAGIIYFTFADM
jgi:ribosomal protein L7/L12